MSTILLSVVEVYDNITVGGARATRTKLEVVTMSRKSCASKLIIKM